MLQLNIGRRDDGLREVAGLARYGNDGLGGVFGIRFSGVNGVRAASIERRQVFRGCVVDDVGVGECGWCDGMRLQSENARGRPDGRECEKVIRGGLQEAAPGQSAVDEDVWPERGGCGFELQWSEFAWLKKIAKILQEDAGPGFGRGQEEQLRGRWFRLCHLKGSRSFAHLSMVDGKPGFRVAGGQVAVF